MKHEDKSKTKPVDRQNDNKKGGSERHQDRDDFNKNPNQTKEKWNDKK